MTDSPDPGPHAALAPPHTDSDHEDDHGSVVTYHDEEDPAGAVYRIKSHSESSGKRRATADFLRSSPGGFAGGGEALGHHHQQPHSTRPHVPQPHPQQQQKQKQTPRTPRRWLAVRLFLADVCDSTVWESLLVGLTLVFISLLCVEVSLLWGIIGSEPGLRGLSATSAALLAVFVGELIIKSLAFEVALWRVPRNVVDAVAVLLAFSLQVAACSYTFSEYGSFLFAQVTVASRVFRLVLCMVREKRIRDFYVSVRILFEARRGANKNLTAAELTLQVLKHVQGSYPLSDLDIVKLQWCINVISAHRLYTGSFQGPSGDVINFRGADDETAQWLLKTYSQTPDEAVQATAAAAATSGGAGVGSSLGSGGAPTGAAVLGTPLLQQQHHGGGGPMTASPLLASSAAAGVGGIMLPASLASGNNNNDLLPQQQFHPRSSSLGMTPGTHSSSTHSLPLNPAASTNSMYASKMVRRETDGTDALVSGRRHTPLYVTGSGDRDSSLGLPGSFMPGGATSEAPTNSSLILRKRSLGAAAGGAAAAAAGGGGAVGASAVTRGEKDSPDSGDKSPSVQMRKARDGRVEKTAASGGGGGHSRVGSLSNILPFLHNSSSNNNSNSINNNMAAAETPGAAALLAGSAGDDEAGFRVITGSSVGIIAKDLLYLEAAGTFVAGAALTTPTNPGSATATPAAEDAVSFQKLRKEMDTFNNEFDDWYFDMFAMDVLTAGYPLAPSLVCALRKNGVFDAFGGGVVSVTTVLNFAMEVELNYDSANPYHNRLHAADVVQCQHHLLTYRQFRESLTPLDRFVSLVAAAVHDLGHPGVNNAFLIATRNPIAIQYNDISVLENMHVATAFEVMRSNPEAYDIFRGLPPGGRTEARETMIQMILATDMKLHFEVLSQFQNQVLQGSAPEKTYDHLGAWWQDMFPVDKDASFSSTVSGASGVGGVMSAYPVDYRRTILKASLHVADVSNPARPSATTRRWADLVQEEFFLQGDLERSANLPVSMFMDRNKPAFPKMQVGFIEFIVKPLMETFWGWLKMFRPVAEPLLLENLDYWKKRQEAEIATAAPSAAAASVTELPLSSATKPRKVTNRMLMKLQNRPLYSRANSTNMVEAPVSVQRPSLVRRATSETGGTLASAKRASFDASLGSPANRRTATLESPTMEEVVLPVSFAPPMNSSEIKVIGGSGSFKRRGAGDAPSSNSSSATSSSANPGLAKKTTIAQAPPPPPLDE